MGMFGGRLRLSAEVFRAWSLHFSLPLLGKNYPEGMRGRTGKRGSGKRVAWRRLREALHWIVPLGVLVLTLSVQDGWTFYGRNPAAIGLAVFIGVFGAVIIVLWQKATPGTRRKVTLGALGLSGIVLPLLAFDTLRISVDLIRITSFYPSDERSMTFLLYVPTAAGLGAIVVTVAIWVWVWRILRQQGRESTGSLGAK